MMMESSINSATILPPYEEEFEPVDNLHWTPETANSIYLFWIHQLQASSGYYRNVGFSSGVAKTTTLLYAHEVADFLLSIAPRFIKQPRPEEYPNLTTTVRDVDGNNKYIIRYNDGVITRIQRPDHAGDAYFCGHGKSCDSINVQYVCDKFGRIRHVISGLPGSTHDKIAAEWSPEFMQYICTHYRTTSLF
ncbi:hypothetical protein LOTGIDRAFT_153018 [Lottia gigantea]|uniref:DDE Tnp4 domain-containing protein n=1 Tax=Lottia gigantea TaxID=225164 RepID=V4AST2_LOTGI|nr:hypothetical protein LOTGIDRAFT_153018 [Lottia gigantea]ESO97910.1 hypothetical protein LOTGIDRAFT_153018 [Lottia gigantea]